MVDAEAARRDAVNRDTVRRTLSFLKDTDALDELLVRAIRLRSGRGYLLPVCRLHASDPELVATLAEWRSDNADAFPTQFPVTHDGTRAWLRERLLDVEDRILFLVVTRHGRPIGHLGLANMLDEPGFAEVDNVVRGVKATEPGLMSEACGALVAWAREALVATTVSLRVFEDNDHAVRFYERLGFEPVERIPLRRRVDGETVAFGACEPTDDAPPDRLFLRMAHTAEHEHRPGDVILTAGPSVSARELAYVFDAARNGWNANWSGYLDRFSEAFAELLGVRYALPTSSCTGALHLALLGAGVGPGDEVIVPDLTWVATANAVSYTGATPVFADVEPDSWCLDAASVESLVTERTRAVVPVHLYGYPARMPSLLDVATRHGLQVIEDAAPAVGAEVDGAKAGSFGVAAAFSFQGAKLLVTGEGGMFTTDDAALFERVESLWDQGRDPKRVFWIIERGWKYKMSNLQAAFGLAQLERIDEMIEAKRRIFDWYDEELAGIAGVTLHREVTGTRSIHWMTSITVDDDAPLTRDELRTALRARDVDTRPVFPAISQYPYWERRQAPQPVSLWIGEHGLNLPSGVRLRRDEVAYVAGCVRELLSRARPRSAAR